MSKSAKKGLTLLRIRFGNLCPHLETYLTVSIASTTTSVPQLYLIREETTSSTISTTIYIQDDELAGTIILYCVHLQHVNVCSPGGHGYCRPTRGTYATVTEASLQ